MSSMGSSSQGLVHHALEEDAKGCHEIKLLEIYRG